MFVPIWPGSVQNRPSGTLDEYRIEHAIFPGSRADRVEHLFGKSIPAHAMFFSVVLSILHCRPAPGGHRPPRQPQAPTDHRDHHRPPQRQREKREDREEYGWRTGERERMAQTRGKGGRGRHGQVDSAHAIYLCFFLGNVGAQHRPPQAIVQCVYTLEY